MEFYRDRFGRLSILRIGFPLYIIGGIAATYAPGLTVMYAARFVAGMGASAVFSTTIAGVRDRFVGDQMARIMSFIFTIFLFTPVLAPFLGLAILSVASWRTVFLTPPLFAVIIFLWSLRLEESLPVEKRNPLDWQSIRTSISKVLGNAVFMRYTAITTLLFSVLSSYVSSSEHIVGGIYGKPQLFAWIFAGIGLLMSICSLLNSYLSLRFGARQTVRWLLICYAVVAGALLAYTLLTQQLPNMFLFFAAVALLLAINIAIEPNSSSLALEPMGNMAGIASAVYGTIFFFVGATIGSIVSELMVTSVIPIVASFFIMGVITLTLSVTDKRPMLKQAKAS